MKKIGCFLLVVCGLVMLSSCAHFWPPPKVVTDTKIIKDENGKVVSSEHTRHIEGRYHNDPETAQSWANADMTARGNQPSNSSVGIDVFMENQSSFTIEVASGEFRGLALGPGEKSSYSKNIPTGAYTFKVRWADQAGRLQERNVSRVITPTTQKIILKDVQI